MAAPFPTTSASLLSKLKHSEGGSWEISWKRFLEIYHEPLEVVARACYRHHTGGQLPGDGFVEDAVADALADFFTRGRHRYDADRAKLRTFLRTIVNARVVDLLRKERPVDARPLPEDHDTLPGESEMEREIFDRALLATLIEDLRNRIPLRQFEIFERIKLKGQSPAYVAEDLGIARAAADRQVHKAMTALRELVREPDYQEELDERSG